MLRTTTIAMTRNNSNSKVYSASQNNSKSSSSVKLLIALPLFIALFALSLHLSEHGGGAPYLAETGLLKYVQVACLRSSIRLN
jgi:hypothetical protein